MPKEGKTRSHRTILGWLKLQYVSLSSVTSSLHMGAEQCFTEELSGLMQERSPPLVNNRPSKREI